eukprot:gene7890-12358_t
MSNDYSVKITILGAGGVGKSQLTLAYLKEKFQDGYDPTIENSYTIKKIINGTEYKTTLVDTAGQDEFKPLMNNWIMESDCFVFCYDMTNKDSIKDVQQIMELTSRHKDSEIQAPGLPYVPSVFVGCKCDLIDKIDKTTTKMAQQVALKEFFIFGKPDKQKLLTMPIFFETSAKEDKGVQEAFESVLMQFQEKLNFIEKSKTPKKTKKKFRFFSSPSNEANEEADEIVGMMKKLQ